MNELKVVKVIVFAVSSCLSLCMCALCVGFSAVHDGYG